MTTVAVGGVIAGLAVPAAAVARTKSVIAGPPAATGKIAKPLLPKGFKAKYNPDIADFFLHRVTINAGDSVRFQINGFHTVDIPAKGQGDLPLFLPTKNVTTGVNDAAGNPFWFDGKLPVIGFNPALLGASGGTTYDGSKRIDSGLPLGPPKPLKVTFTKAGVYKFYCDVHPGMVGYVVVKPRNKPVPTARQDLRSLTSQITRDVLSARKLSRTKVTGDNVSLGASNSFGVELFSMFPATVSVKKGTVVTFAMSKDTRQTHTASFGPLSYVSSLANAFGSSLTLPSEGVYPSSPTQPISETQTAHGNGFANTGVLDQDPTTTALPPAGKIRFDQAGIYHFICLIHPFMHGTIVVTP
jgi:plastocyanin